MTYREGQPVTTGLFELINTGTSPVTVQSVSLPTAHGLRMTHAWLVPTYRDPKNGNFLNVGVGYPYPPAYNALVRAVWAKRQPAVGGKVRPGQDLNLVFGLTRTSVHDGKSAGPVIVYSASGTNYTMQEATHLIVSRNCLALP